MHSALLRGRSTCGKDGARHSGVLQWTVPAFSQGSVAQWCPFFSTFLGKGSDSFKLTISWPLGI